MNQQEYDAFYAKHFQVYSYASTLDTHELVYINDVLKEWLDLSGDSYKGKKCYEILQNRSEPCPYCSNPKLKQGEVYRYSTYQPVLGRNFAIKNTLISGETGPIRVEFGYDITDEFEEINHLKDAQALDKAVITCAGTLLDTTVVDNAIQTLLETVAEYHDADRAYIFEIDYGSKFCSNTYEHCHRDVSSQIYDLQDVPLDVIDHWLECFKTDHYVAIDVNYKLERRLEKARDFLHQLKISSLLLVPLFTGCKISGFIGVDHPRRLIHSPELMMTVAAFVRNDFEKRAGAIELCNAVNDLQKSLDQSSILFQSAQLLLSDNNSDVAMTHLLENISGYLGADSAYVFEFSKEERLLKNSHYYDNQAHVPPRDASKHCHRVLNQIHLSPSLVMESTDFFVQKYFLLRQWEKSNPREDLDFLIYKMLECDTCILAPFYKEGVIAGFLGIDNPRTNVDHQEVITTISAFVGNTLEKRGMMHRLEGITFADELTGLKNRNAYLQKLKEYRRSTPTHFGVIFADINDLKSINHHLGQEAGDDLILWTVKFLQGSIRDPIYRIGGDEFVAFLPNITESAFQERVSYLRMGQSRLKFPPFSFGSVWSEAIEDIDDFIVQADEEMQAKKEVFFTSIHDQTFTPEEKRDRTLARLNELSRG